MPRLTTSSPSMFLVWRADEHFICDSEDSARMIVSQLIREHCGETVVAWPEINRWLESSDLDIGVDRQRIWSVEYSAVEELSAATVKK